MTHTISYFSRVLIAGMLVYGLSSQSAHALCEPEKDPSVISAQAAYDKATAEHVQERQRMHDVYSSSQLKPTAKEKARERQLDSDEHKAAKALEKAYAQVRPCMALSTFDSSGREVPVRPALPGSGNESQGADELLTYPGMTSTHLTQHQFGKGVAIQVHYSERADIRTFSATLNGQDVSEHFSPGWIKKQGPDVMDKRPMIDGVDGVIGLPLQPGDNILVLKIAELDAPGLWHAPYWDEDVFQITVKPGMASGKAMALPPQRQ